jgi:hypothetical protein
MSPHYDRYSKPTEQQPGQTHADAASEEEIENAAEALRETEVEAVQSDPPPQPPTPTSQS